MTLGPWGLGFRLLKLLKVECLPFRLHLFFQGMGLLQLFILISIQPSVGITRSKTQRIRSVRFLGTL